MTDPFTNLSSWNWGGQDGEVEPLGGNEEKFLGAHDYKTAEEGVGDFV